MTLPGDLTLHDLGSKFSQKLRKTWGVRRMETRRCCAPPYFRYRRKTWGGGGGVQPPQQGAGGNGSPSTWGFVLSLIWICFKFKFLTNEYRLFRSSASMRRDHTLRPFISDWLISNYSNVISWWILCATTIVLIKLMITLNNEANQDPLPCDRCSHRGGRLQSLYPLDRGGLSRGAAVPAGLHPARISMPCRGYLERPVARDQGHPIHAGFQARPSLVFSSSYIRTSR